jgi:hypothetical protein
VGYLQRDYATFHVVLRHLMQNAADTYFGDRLQLANLSGESAIFASVRFGMRMLLQDGLRCGLLATDVTIDTRGAAPRESSEKPAYRGPVYRPGR